MILTYRILIYVFTNLLSQQLLHSVCFNFLSITLLVSIRYIGLSDGKTTKCGHNYYDLGLIPEYAHQKVVLC